VLCGTRHGDLGSYRWTERIEARLGLIGTAGRWYVGRPVIVTRNDHLNRLFNGDTGIYVATPDGDPAVVFPAGADGTRRVATAQLAESETWWAMTVHKSQGSEFDEVVVSLPTTESPILTRELLYTGVTRAKEKVTIVATEAALRAAIGRPVQRATGLRAALSVPPPGA
jgi:exodeoxyribonuclease V alpha subunit